MRHFLILTFSTLMIGLLSACSSGVTDQEGNPIETVTIGHQTWMAENLNVSTFQNGDPIPEVTNAQEWVKAGEAGQPAWCHFENNPANGARFGKLYNYYAATDPRGLAPEGWRVPSDDDWLILADAVGGMDHAGTKLKSRSGWKNNGNGTDEFGFNVLPGGGRGGQSGFTGQGTVAVFWSSTSKSPSFGWYRVLHAHRTAIFQESDDKMSGFAIRCVKND